MPECSDISKQLFSAAVDPDEAWESLLDPSIPGNIWRALEESEAESVGDVAGLLDRCKFEDLKGVGPTSRRRLVDELEELIELGREHYLYGTQGRPDSIEQMIQQGLDLLEDRRGYIVRRRIYDGLRYRDFTPEMDVTYQRVQQLMKEAVSELQWRFQDVAQSLLSELMDDLRHGVPFVEEDDARLYVGEPELELDRVVFALKIAGLEDVHLWRDLLLTTLTSHELENWCNSLVEYMKRQTTIELEFAHMEAWADAQGLEFERDTLLMLAEHVADVDLSDGPVLPQWTYKQDVVAEALWRCGGPADADEIRLELQKLRERFPEIPHFAGHAMRSLMQCHDAVFNIDHGVYIHAANMSVTRRTLQEAARWAASRLDGQTDAITTHDLLEEMSREKTVPEGLTPHLLKSALNQREDVLSLTNTDLVAHRKSYEDTGKKIEDRIRDVLNEAAKPLNVEELTEALDRFGYARTSVSSAVKDMTKVLQWEDGTFNHWASLAVEPNALAAAARGAYEVLPEDGIPMSANQLFDALSPEIREGLAEFHDPVRLLFALTRSHRDFATSATKLVARRDDPWTNPVHNAIYAIVDDEGSAPAITVRNRLEEQFGYEGSKETVYASLRHLCQRGVLGHEKGGDYWLSE